MVTYRYDTRSGNVAFQRDIDSKTRPVTIENIANSETLKMTVLEMDELATMWLALRMAERGALQKIEQGIDDAVF